MKKPVLFLIFNRPNYTKQVFEAIKLYQPIKLYIAADGPRKNLETDLKLCEETKSIIKLIDWECETKTLFREYNVGCKKNISDSINWLFENENDGIILEDDVVPNLDFFYFCEYCLDKYADDERIMMITGTNYLNNEKLNSTYFYSKHYTIWGWATWKRAWKNYDINMKKWQDKDIKSDIKYLFNKNYIWRHFKYTFDSLETYENNNWDIQWVFACIINNGYCITPKVNLISNIGVFGTHSKNITISHNLKRYTLGLPSKYISPSNFLLNSSYDKKLHYISSRKSNKKYFMIRILINLKIYKILKYIKNKFVKF